MKDFSLSSTWQNEIAKRARSPVNIIILIVGAIIVVLLFVTCILDIIPFLQGDIKTGLNIFAALFGIIFSLKLLPPVRDWYKPRRLYYRSAAVAIIEELGQQGNITESTEQQLKDIALRLLGSLEDGNCESNPKDLLKQACDEMAETVETNMNSN